MNFISLFEYYTLHPEEFWPKTHERNIKKINRFIEQGRKIRGEGINKYIQNIINIAQLRQGFHSSHLYLVNAGSSGSHWIEAMLGLLPGFYNSGEVYLPSDVRKSLSLLDSENANLFLDALYILHTGRIHSDALTSSLSNSAHIANHSQISKFSRNKVALLLLRNPVDIVISRSFRKDEYRNDIAPSISDKDYLEKNCIYVEKFYNSISNSTFDMTVKYEDFVTSPKENLKKLVDLIGLNVSDAKLDNAIFKTSKEEEIKSIEKGSGAITNIYMGEKKEYKWAKDYIKERLSKTLGENGYL